MKTFRQIIAIAHTEFRFGFRRGGPVIPVLLTGLVLSISIWMVTIMGINNFNASMQYNFYSDPVKMQMIQAAGITLPTISDEANSINTEGLFGSWSYFYILTFLLLVSAAAPTIPADRQFRAMELFRSLPIGSGTYLAGKVLGVIVVSSLVAISPLVAICAIPLILVGSTSFKGIAMLVLLDGLPLLISAIMLGVFIGAPLGRRFSAVVFGLFGGILGLIAIILASTENPYIGGAFLTPAAAYVLRITDTSGMPRPQVSVIDVVLFYTVSLVVFILMAFLVRLWLQWKENF